MNNINLDLSHISYMQLLSLEHEALNILYEQLRTITSDIFDFCSLEENECLPTLIHKATGMSFKFIPGGEYDMGLSKREETSAKKLCDPLPFDVDRLRPVHRVQVSPLLVSCFPITNSSISRRFDFGFDDPEMDNLAVGLTREQAEYLTQVFGCRLPTEEEWEHFCRAGTETLFTFGDDLPDTDEELESWLSLDFSDPTKLPKNNFGLYGLFGGEWCLDYFRETYDPEASYSTRYYTVRGGGSLFWPWQDQEWIWCMSAMRTSSKDIFFGDSPYCTCCVRLVYDLGNLPN